MVRSELSDAQRMSQFFTRPETAQWCVDNLMKYLRSAGQNPNSKIYLEPSAGEGVFLDLLPRGTHQIAVEADPRLCVKHPNYLYASLDTDGFLGMSDDDLGLSRVPTNQVIAIGNPPFSNPKERGRGGIIALDFINHACKYADVVAFIVGCTFRRPLTINKVDSNFHCVFDENLPSTEKKHFLLEGERKSVKCIFQIWQRMPVERVMIPKIVKRGGEWGGDWRFVSTTDESANIRIRQWGSADTIGQITGPETTREIVKANIATQKRTGKCGKLLDRCWYYLHADNPADVIRKFKARIHLFKELAWDRSMGNNPDIPLDDLVRIYTAPANSHYVSGRYVDA